MLYSHYYYYFFSMIAWCISVYVKRCVSEEYRMPSWIRSCFFEYRDYTNHALEGSSLSSGTFILHRFRRMSKPTLVYLLSSRWMDGSCLLLLNTAVHTYYLVPWCVHLNIICIMVIRALATCQDEIYRFSLSKGSWWWNLWRVMLR